MLATRWACRCTERCWPLRRVQVVAASVERNVRDGVMPMVRGQTQYSEKHGSIQHNTLMARKHVERGLIPGQWRRPAARKCAARLAPPEEPNATGNTSAAPASESTAAVVPSLLPTLEVVPLDSVEPVLVTPGAAPSVPIPTHSNSQPPPFGRVRHRGRDPTCTIDALPGETLTALGGVS